MTEFLLLCLWLFMAYAEQIFAACLIGMGLVLCGLEMGAVVFVFFIFGK